MNRPLIWAHRGASGTAPENTLAAFSKAIEDGADGIELDIQLTKDGELVVCHDEAIDRTSSGKGLVMDYTLEELKKMDFSNGLLEYEGEKIPTMEEVFDLVKPSDLSINIELKTGIIFYPDIEKKIVELTRDKGMEDRVIYSSFNHSSVLKIREYAPDAVLGFLYADGPVDPVEYALRYGVQALHPMGFNLRYDGFMEAAKKAGIRVNTWTINKDADIRECIARGADAIITNYPAKARKITEEVCE